MYKEGACLQKGSSLNLMVFVVLVLSSVNMLCIMALVCNDQNNACLGCDQIFKNVTLPWSSL